MDRPAQGDVEAILGSIPEVLRAPWTEDQVDSLNEFQEAGVLHPFTCNGGRLPSQHEHDEEVVLVAKQDGWHCPLNPGHKQDWAWPLMANWGWRNL